MINDRYYMALAIMEAEKAFKAGEVPVGAVIVRDGEVLSRAYNLRESLYDPTAHSEVLAIREASIRLGNWRLENCTIYVTKEPCPMCAGAMVNARIKRLVYGCRDEKGGAAESLYMLLSDQRLNHQVEVISGILADESAELLRRFFKEKRVLS